MKKTINISIGKMSFIAEEDAFVKLDGYLNSLKSHFASYPEAEEIISDIESRMAEQFLAKAINKIITLPLVEELIKTMGSPEELGGQQQSPAAGAGESKQNFNKKMFRNPDDVIIAGVASGIAAYFGIDSVWVRLGFVLLTLGSGFGIILYIVLWIILPEAKTDTEKMQMRGEPVNLKNVEAVVKERVEEFKKKDQNKIKKVLLAPVYAVGAVLRAIAYFLKKLFPIIFRILGAVISIAASLALAGLIFVFISLLINLNSPYIDFPLREIAFGTTYYLALISAFFVVFVPLILLALLGTSLLALRSTLSKFAGLSLFVLWIVAVAVAANLGIKLAPQIQNAYDNDPNYKQVSQNIDLKDFNSIEVNSAFKAKIYKGSEFKITAAGRQTDLENINASVQENQLKLNYNYKKRVCVFCFNRPVEFEIYLPSIEKVIGTGASQISTQGFTTDNFSINLSGASRADLEINAVNLTGTLSGASRLTVKGYAKNINLSGSGASQFYGEDINPLIEDAKIKLSGASQARLNNVNVLTVEASGASKVYYFTAGNITSKLSGASKLVPNTQPTTEDNLYYIDEPEENFSPQAPAFPPSTTTPQIKDI